MRFLGFILMKPGPTVEPRRLNISLFMFLKSNERSGRLELVYPKRNELCT